MAKIKTRKRVDPTAVDKRLEQVGLTPGLVMRSFDETHEYEIEAVNASISADDLSRIVDALPEVPHPDEARRLSSERRTARRGSARDLLAKSKWSPVDTEAALRLLLTAELERD